MDDDRKLVRDGDCSAFEADPLFETQSPANFLAGWKRKMSPMHD